MSARLIKSTEGNNTPLAPFVLPQTNDFKNNGEAKSFAFPSLQTGTQQAKSEVAADKAANNLASAQTEAQQTLAQARAEAEQILMTAKTRAVEIEQEARAKGEAEARANIAIEVEQQAAEIRRRLAQTIDEITNLSSRIAANAEHEMVQLAIEIAKKIVHREVTVDREIALTLARVALTRLHTRSVATVRLHPSDFHYALAHRDQLDSDGAVEIVEDKSVGIGGCIVQTEMGDIDARIVQQFREIEKGFWG
jgi:flagellar assembly protein FliH